ncbi:hypothetical protein VKA52_12635 [Halobacillus sp. HZG1]|uniref:hypothetical protein n=1 Tax=Halobacillus sp. HZG1 TaxID=3111769 RepID=UPI002DBAD80B|nr:hypothetical protein [Halobacillus sp. HZG1]MEC3884573.1 hypothetical protein [Halobacillus sp. HZG1]
MKGLQFNQSEVNAHLSGRIAVLEHEKAILLAEKNALLRRVNELEGEENAN